MATSLTALSIASRRSYRAALKELAGLPELVDVASAKVILAKLIDLGVAGRLHGVVLTGCVRSVEVFLKACDSGVDLTVREAARRLGVNPSSVRRHLEAGRLAGYRLGRGAKANWRVRADALDAFRMADPCPDGESSARPVDMGSWRRVGRRTGGERRATGGEA